MNKVYFSYLKHIVNKLLKKIDFRLERDYSHKLLKTLLSKTDLVIDIGANTGQYANKLRKLNFNGKIISIEPLAEAHSKLIENARGDLNWDVLDQMAIGSEEGYIKINKSINLVSSSLLEILPNHTIAAPESKYISQEEVRISTLSNIFKILEITDATILLKIDTQGFEFEVLYGALEVIDKITFIEIELSVQELYGGQKLFLELLNMLEGLNFKLISLDKSFENKVNGMLLQFDAIFCKSNVLNKMLNTLN